MGLNDPPRPPRLTAIIPARNAAATLGQCLDALLAQVSADEEVIVVDDYSTDETSEIASHYDVNLIKLSRHQGVSAARNRGAQLARAPVLFFVDADVVVAPGTITRAQTLMSRSDVGAVIGSYDEDPSASSTVSRFKNLAHHYFHQSSNAEATTFWGACGLVRRDSFFAAGGFNEDRFSIEDVELGYALVAQGVRIVMDPDLQVKHLKKWTLWSMIITDVVRRAIPWTLLCLKHQRLSNNLNFSTEQRVAALVTLAIALVSTIAIVQYRLWAVVVALVSIALWLNLDLYRLFLRKGGLWLAVNGFLLQQLYYLYSTFGLVAGLTIHFAKALTLYLQATLRRVRV
jgi:glycosyltransferase involved in cell wall biosynthesis